MRELGTEIGGGGLRTGAAFRQATFRESLNIVRLSCLPINVHHLSLS
jgi:hypothetical protein